MKPIEWRIQANRLTVPTLVLGIASSLFAAQSLAQTAPTAAKPMAGAAAKSDTKADAQAQEIIKFSQDGNAAMREVRGARFAIFNGDPKTSMQLMENAKASVAAAEKDAPSFGTRTTMSVQGKVVGTPAVKGQKAQEIPFDGQLMLGENFVMTPEKQAHIDKANEHFKNGRNKEALEELRLGEIDVSYTRLWMPIAATNKDLDQAIKLSRDHKYYEANLALKAIEDGVVVDSVSLADTAKK